MLKNESEKGFEKDWKGRDDWEKEKVWKICVVKEIEGWNYGNKRYKRRGGRNWNEL